MKEKTSQLPQVKASELQEMLKLSYDARVPLIIRGHPGVSKSANCDTFAYTWSMGTLFTHVPYCAPEDFKFPFVDRENNTVRFVVPGCYPTVSNVKAGRLPAKGVWVLEELVSAPNAIQALFGEPFYDRKLNGEPLAEGWHCVATGNMASSRAVVHRMPSHICSRLMHVELVVDLQEWTQWALTHDVEPEVLAYYRNAPGDLDEFDPEKWQPDTTFSCPRSAEALSKLLKAGGGKLSHAQCVATVGEVVGTRFKAFLDSVNKLPNLDLCLMDPEHAPVPDEPSLCYMVATGLARKADDKNFAKVVQYCTRMDKMFEVLCVRDALKINMNKPQNNIHGCKAFVEWALKNQEVFKD